MVRPSNIERSQWEAAKLEAREAMVATARLGMGTMTYHDLANRISVLHLEPSSFLIRELTDEISYEEELAGRGMLGAVVIHQGGDERWSRFLRQPAKVDSPMQRTNHHEDAETVFG